MRQCALLLFPSLIFFLGCFCPSCVSSLSHFPRGKQHVDRRRLLTSSISFVFLNPSSSLAAVDQGISVVTESDLGKSIRRSAIQGARVIDAIDEKWERFSDKLRDQNKCDESTGRRLFDNGFRRDGTRVGNPVLGALCNPVSLAPLNDEVAREVRGLALDAAVKVGVDSKKLDQAVERVDELVRSSFDRSMAGITDEAEIKRKLYNFAMYTTMRAINEEMKGLPNQKSFQLAWGELLVSKFAPNADRRDYKSPFPEVKDEFEDYDYDKGTLLDGLGTLTVALSKLQESGLLRYFEISIPYDDYGSVVTVAVDDDVTLGSQQLLREQTLGAGGSFVVALAERVLHNAKIDYALDVFFIDPTTTKQSQYNPSQLLLSLSNLRGGPR